MTIEIKSVDQLVQLVGSASADLGKYKEKIGVVADLIDELTPGELVNGFYVAMTNAGVSPATADANAHAINYAIRDTRKAIEELLEAFRVAAFQASTIADAALACRAAATSAQGVTGPAVRL